MKYTKDPITMYEEMKDRYLRDLFSNKDDKEAIRKALEYALDIRKFEISLYWKRATYLWAFIAAIFAAFFASLNASNLNKELVLGVTVVGYIFTWCWYLANRGSKYWQENWEMHVDFLEDAVMGSLYKTVRNPENQKFYRLFESYPCSVTRINQVLNITILIAWAVLFLTNLFPVFNQNPPESLYGFGSIFLIVISLIIFWVVKSKLPRNGVSAAYINRKAEIVRKSMSED